MDLILLLPLLFIAHDGEEILTQRRWMGRNSGHIVSRFPQAKRMVSLMSGVSTGRFSLMVAEELAIILAGTWLYVEGCPMPLVCLFYGYGLHLVVHVVQFAAMRGYVPGIVTAVAELPFVAYLATDIAAGYSVTENALLALVGIVFAGANVVLVHWLFEGK